MRLYATGILAAVLLSFPQAECQDFPLRLFGIGDWGNTQPETGADKDAQRRVAEAMAKYGASVRPVAVATHGDNFYWGGLANPNHEKFQEAFENVYTGDSLKDVPFLLTLGNHDIGGNAYLCGKDPGTSAQHDKWHVPCNSKQEAIDATRMYYQASQSYSSQKKGSGRLTFDGAYYMRAFKVGSLSVEVYIVDTNVVDSGHICCQKDGYGQCADRMGGVPRETFDGCMEVLRQSFSESMAKLGQDLDQSTATWKVVSTHYCPTRHIGGPELQSIVSTVKDRVHVWMCGHTHTTVHDYMSVPKLHVVMNGAGGGIVLDGPSSLGESGEVSTVWAPPRSAYAFTDLQMSAEWMKISFVTYDTTVTGGKEVMACRAIPVKPGPAVECDTLPSQAPAVEQPPVGGKATNQSSEDSAQEPGGTQGDSSPTALLLPTTTSSSVDNVVQQGSIIGSDSGDPTAVNEAAASGASRNSTTVMLSVVMSLAGVGAIVVGAAMWYRRRRNTRWRASELQESMVYDPRSRTPRESSVVFDSRRGTTLLRL